MAKRLSGCGSGTEYLAVTPWGDFYPCHQFVGEEEFLLGNVDTGVTNTQIAMNLNFATFMQKTNVGIASQGFIAAGAVQLTPIISWKYY